MADPDPKDPEGIQDNGTTRRTSDVFLPSDYQDEDCEEEDAEGKEKRGPEIHAEFQLSGRQTGQSTDVYGPVKPCVHALNCHCRIDDDSLAAFEDSDVSFCVGVLFDDESGDVRFDSSGAETDDDHGDDKPGCVCCFACLWNRSADEDELAGDVECREEDDGLVAAEVLIRHNGAYDRADIAPELEEVAQACRTTLSEIEIAPGGISRRELDVVLEWRTQSVECESFTQFNNDNEPMPLKVETCTRYHALNGIRSDTRLKVLSSSSVMSSVESTSFKVLDDDPSRGGLYVGNVGSCICEESPRATSSSSSYLAPSS